MRFLVLFVVMSVILGAQDPSEKLINASDCSSCHSADRQLVGPSYNAIAKRYASQADAIAKLAAKVQEGGSGVWGDLEMPPHPDIKDATARQMVSWILSAKTTMPASAPSRAKAYTYKLKNGSTRELDFPVYAEGKAPKVTYGHA